MDRMDNSTTDRRCPSCLAPVSQVDRVCFACHRPLTQATVPEPSISSVQAPSLVTPYRSPEAQHAVTSFEPESATRTSTAPQTAPEAKADPLVIEVQWGRVRQTHTLTTADCTIGSTDAS